ncbi:TPA: ATP-binding protein [Pseudomonas aeruginosa]|uniref:ATP-binding protein n=1 Tax=Pseudomonas aeruginosa TaxID=287 RepID=UPI00165FC194|nr:AAA family ATPase [Pseudomonas aeruginosa]
MHIKSFRIDISCSGAQFGFSTTFQKGLNIIRGSNSSGKSTIVNCLLYSLGMEELVGGKGEAALSYAVRDYVIHDEKKTSHN